MTINKSYKGFGHIIGPVNIEKTNGTWRVVLKGNELAAGITFFQAKKLAHIEQKKHELLQLPLAMSSVPRPCKKINLHTKLAPSQWKRLSKNTYAIANGRCEICDKEYPELDCHEVWAYDDYKHIQRLDKLIAICRICHRAIHFTSGYMALLGLKNPMAYEQVEKHFLKVNKVKRATMQAHERLATWLYNERGNHSWIVDFGNWADLVAQSDRADVDEVKRRYKSDKTGDGIIRTPKIIETGASRNEHVTRKSIIEFFNESFDFDSGIDHKIVRATKELACGSCEHVIPKGALYALRAHKRLSARACFDCLLHWQDESGPCDDGYMGPDELTIAQEESYFQQKND